jgi:hypothetical protein
MAKTPLGYGSQNRCHSSRHSKEMAICRALAALGASGGVRVGETIVGSAKAPLWAFQAAPPHCEGLPRRRCKRHHGLGRPLGRREDADGQEVDADAGLERGEACSEE